MRAFCRETFFEKKFLPHPLQKASQKGNVIKLSAKEASPFGRGGGVADGEGEQFPSHPLSRELSQRESLS